MGILAGKQGLVLPAFPAHGNSTLGKELFTFLTDFFVSSFLCEKLKHGVLLMNITCFGKEIQCNFRMKLRSCVECAVHGKLCGRALGLASEEQGASGINSSKKLHGGVGFHGLSPPRRLFEA